MDEEESLFEKPRGQRRWLGKEHHRGKEHLYNQMKDRTYIQKTIKDASKKQIKKLQDGSRDEFVPNVYYSIDKKNRWKSISEDELLGGSAANVRTQVVERNVLREFGFDCDKRSTFAVYRKTNIDLKYPMDFDVERAESSGPGQHEKCFFPQWGDVNAKKIEHPKTDPSNSSGFPTVSYNIFRVHRSKHVVGGRMFQSKVGGKSKRKRPGRKTDAIDFEEDGGEEDEDDREEEEDDSEESQKAKGNIDLSEYIENKLIRKPKSFRISEQSNDDVEIIEKEFGEQLNIPDLLASNPHTFFEADIQLADVHHKMVMAEEFDILSGQENIKCHLLNDHQLYVDASRLCNAACELTMIIVFTSIEEGIVNVSLNSTIPSNPSTIGEKPLNRLLADCQTIFEMVKKIGKTFATNHILASSMKENCEYYKFATFHETLSFCPNWLDQEALTNLPFPNRNAHLSWTLPNKILNDGSRHEPEHVYSTARESCSILNAVDILFEKCWECDKRTKILVQLLDGSAKCRNCLRREFYAQFRVKTIPVELEIANVHPFDILPSIVPLPILNLYIRLIYESIYRDLGASGDFATCPSCKCILYLENAQTDNIRCSCGYCWCPKCKKQPHWPMNCEEFENWDNRWRISYAYFCAQGNGTEELLEITCQCRKSIFWVKMPTDNATCPECKVLLDMTRLMENHKYYYPYTPTLRKQTLETYGSMANTNFQFLPYKPIALTRTRIAVIVRIRKEVVEVCATARTLRLDESYSRLVRNRDGELAKRHDIEAGRLEETILLILYMVEHVNAWMYIANRFDKSIRKTLRVLMRNIEELFTIDSESVEQYLTNMETKISEIIKKIKTQNEDKSEE